MANKVRVYGKAQNRTALGIVNAYVVMYPHATLEDLRKAFPNSLNPDQGVSELFLPVDEAKAINKDKNMSLYFAKDDEVIHLNNGQTIALSQIWSKPSFERIVAQGKLYDVEVAAFEKTAHPGQKGGFRLEYLNGYVPPVPAEEKKGGIPWWVWLLIGLVVAGVIIALCLPGGDKSEPQVIEKEKIIEKSVVVRDTVYVQKVAEIEANFNAAQFEQGKYDLNDDAKLALHDLAQLMKQNPEMKLSIEGHTSSEGDAQKNQILSEQRAQAAVDFLVNKEGIDTSRLSAAGKGSSQPKDAANPASNINRRTEFIIKD